MMKKLTVQVPATSANCGPGYDTLGLACNLYNILTFELLDNQQLILQVSGEGSSYLNASPDNLAFKGFFDVWNAATDSKPTGLKITMENNIPMSRGLGSSSSAIVAGVYAANILSGETFTKDQLLAFATEIEGHPDNVAPAIYGGFTISYMDEEGAHSLCLKPSVPLKFIAVVPEVILSTSVARKAIPQQISHKDAVFNVSRAALLVGALLSGRYEFLNSALQDKMHQPFRAHLIPSLDKVFQAAVNNGAFNAIISGAGSTVMAYAAADAEHQKIAEAMCNEFTKAGIKSSYHILDMDYDGVKKYFK